MLSSDHEKEKLDAGHKGIRGVSFISGNGLAQDCVCVCVCVCVGGGVNAAQWGDSSELWTKINNKKSW